MNGCLAITIPEFFQLADPAIASHQAEARSHDHLKTNPNQVAKEQRGMMSLGIETARRS